MSDEGRDAHPPHQPLPFITVRRPRQAELPFPRMTEFVRDDLAHEFVSVLNVEGIVETHPALVGYTRFHPTKRKTQFRVRDPVLQTELMNAAESLLLERPFIIACRLKLKTYRAVKTSDDVQRSEPV